jgi:hypothetical protein
MVQILSALVVAAASISVALAAPVDFMEIDAREP